MSTAVIPSLELPKVSLYFKSGSSDKEYHLEIKGDEATGYFVEYRYGKRGQKLRTANKNKMAIDYSAAKRIYDENLQSQLKDGYTPNVDGTPYVRPEMEGKDSGIHPQLLNPITESEVDKYINDDEWVAQEKKDGVRIMMRKAGKSIDGINREGFIVSLPETVVDPFKNLMGKADAIIDGELIGEHYFVFDTLSLDIHAYAGKPYKDRLEAIVGWFSEENTQYCNQHFSILPTAVGKASKRALLTRLKKENAEGIVFKRLRAVYTPGRPTSYGDQVKFKFWASASVRVRTLNAKSSFQMEVLSKGDWVFIGNCTLPVNAPALKTGDIAEVKYLYAYSGGSLFEPSFLSKRTDISEDECLMSQLKYKQGTEEGE